MLLAAKIAVVVVAVLHIGFLYLEMFAWARPLGRKIFAMGAEQAESTRVLAANQGLYNGFLVVGLGWGLWRGNLEITLLFLSFVVVAGIYGALSVDKKIFLVQSAPALLAAGLLWGSS